ncbi:hypothetical protein GGR50DRAFT_692465 [Xylaria sp. CBS 124048]|nr:hypothetical protein GGR50DRAFT_692465 [Xylaria sp. CBS 124048]
MDSISKRLIGDSIKLDRKIAALLASLDAFAHTVREARADLDAVSRELHSLQAVLGLLGEEAPLLPADIAVQGPALLEHCSGAVDQLDEYVSTLDRLGLSRLEKRTHWLGTGRLETASFASTLEAHRVTIGLSLDLAQA